MSRLMLLAALATATLAGCTDSEIDTDPKVGADVGQDLDLDTAADTAVDHAHDLFHEATLESCDAPKVLICHIPPGNPANAHNICIAEPAVQAHIANHGDYLGVCESAPPPPPPPPPVCEADGDACYVDSDCCSLSCVGGVCGAGT